MDSYSGWFVAKNEHNSSHFKEIHGYSCVGRNNKNCITLHYRPGQARLDTAINVEIFHLQSCMFSAIVVRNTKIIILSNIEHGNRIASTFAYRTNMVYTKRTAASRWTGL